MLWLYHSPWVGELSSSSGHKSQVHYTVVTSIEWAGCRNSFQATVTEIYTYTEHKKEENTWQLWADTGRTIRTLTGLPGE